MTSPIMLDIISINNSWSKREWIFYLFSNSILPQKYNIVWASPELWAVFMVEKGGKNDAIDKFIHKHLLFYIFWSRSTSIICHIPREYRRMCFFIVNGNGMHKNKLKSKSEDSFELLNVLKRFTATMDFQQEGGHYVQSKFYKFD